MGRVILGVAAPCSTGQRAILSRHSLLEWCWALYCKRAALPVSKQPPPSPCSPCPDPIPKPRTHPNAQTPSLSVPRPHPHARDPSPCPFPPLTLAQRPHGPAGAEPCAQHLRGCPRPLARLLPAGKKGEGAGFQLPVLRPYSTLGSQHLEGQLGRPASRHGHAAESHQLPAGHRHRGLLPAQVELHHL